MARQIGNAKLDTRSARAKLPMRKAPYWASITPGCTLGYRKTPRKGAAKSSRCGVWLAKYVGEGIRRETTLGPADDFLDADSVTALDFAQAQEKARAWFSKVGREAAGEEGSHGPYTVADAARDYMEWFRAERKSVRDTQYMIDAHSRDGESSYTHSIPPVIGVLGLGIRAYDASVPDHGK